VAIDQEKALGLLFRAVTPGAGDPAEDLVMRLCEIRDAKGAVLTDDEFEECRQSVIEQIVSRVGAPLVYRVTLPLMLAGCIALACWGLASGSPGLAIGALISSVLCATIWRGIERDYAAKRALPPSSRLAIVDRLLQEQLITEAEATKYRGQIEEL
jgi:hypothetical protein